MAADQFTHYVQRVRAEFDVVFKVPITGAGETTRDALGEEAVKQVSHHITTSNKVEIEALRGPSGSQPVYNNGKGLGTGTLPEHYIEADWPEEEAT
jgi:hypothetical protein